MEVTAAPHAGHRGRRPRRTPLAAVALGVTLVVAAGCPAAGRAADEAAGPLRAVVTRPVHPLLVRNEHGPMLRVAIELPAGREAVLHGVSLSLAGTDSLDDVESLACFATGTQPGFAAATPYGGRTAAAKSVTFRGDLTLRSGTNHLWFSCRLRDSADITHRVAAACERLDTSLGSLVPADPGPPVRQRLGIALRTAGDDGVHTCRIPAVTKTDRGTLLCVYDMRRRGRRDLQEDIDIGLSRSIDGGRTWEPPRVIMDMGEFGGLPQEQNGCSDPGIVVDRRTGEAFCFAVWMNGKPGKHQWNDDGSEPGFEIGTTAQLLMVRSRDDGRTWSRPENLTRGLKHEDWWLLAPSPQSGFQRADGTLVMPMQGRTGRHRLETFATIMTSRDHGATWTLGAPAYTGGNECQAAELGDGGIMLNVRNDRATFRAVAVTRDLGATWETHPTSGDTLIEPTCNGSLIRVAAPASPTPRHFLLFANPHSQASRTHQSLQVSLDDGLTWPAERRIELDEGRGNGYPSLVQIDDDRVGIVYEGSQAQLVFQTVTIAELLGR